MQTTDLRRHYRALRDALGEEERILASRAICQRLAALPEIENSPILFAYAPLGSEVDLEPWLRDCIARGKIVALPRVTGPGEMAFHAVPSWDKLTAGAYGIREPKDAWEILSPDAASLILIPGLVFSRQGARIGYGGGFYDRYLPRTNATKVMLAFSCQEAQFSPCPHDVPMDKIVTEDALYTCT